MGYTKTLENIKSALNRLTNSQVDVCLDPEMARSIELWAAMYADTAPWLSAKEGIVSAGLPSAIASEFARLVSLEFKSEVDDVFINSVYQNALKDLRVQVEFACALGGIVLKPYPVNDKINVQYIRADRFFPLTFDSSGRISKGAFVEQIRREKKIFTRLEIPAIENGTLRVQNAAYVSGNNQSLGGQIPLESVDVWADLQPEAIFPGVDKLPIGYFKIPLANTINPESPLGVSVFSRSVPRIKEADKRYSNICWELEGTQLAVHIAESLLRLDKNTDKLKVPKGKERLYRALSHNTGPVDKPLLDTFNPDIRIAALIEAYQAQLKMIEFECGLAYGALSDPQVIDKTATEVRYSKQRSYATVTDIQMALQNALIDAVDGIAFWASQIGKVSTDTALKMGFNWDDSIITDSDTLAARALLEYQSGIIDKVRYFMQVYGMSEEAARKLVASMAEREPAPGNFFLGDET